MKNYNVSIINTDTEEKITDYTIEEENETIARLLGIGRFRRQFPNLADTKIKAIAKSSLRTIVPIQEPHKWEYL